ncbi:MAG: hypothetical protein IJU70_00570 [Lentisphaeria bacterium]|nr:hypothetical protein [Lentisphaeria bacterium]
MRKYIVLLIFAAAAGAGAFLFLRGDSDEARVKKVIRRLCDMTTKREGENPAAGALLISRTDEIFAPEVHIEAARGGFDGSYTPGRLTSELARCRAVFRRVTVRAQDEEISFPEKDKAFAVFSGTLSGDTKTGTSVSEVRDVECRLVRLDGKWKISGMVVHEVLER